MWNLFDLILICAAITDLMQLARKYASCSITMAPQKGNSIGLHPPTHARSDRCQWVKAEKAKGDLQTIHGLQHRSLCNRGLNLSMRRTRHLGDPAISV